MNIDTGQIHRGEDVEVAKKRGERLVTLTEAEAAQLNRVHPEQRPVLLAEMRAAEYRRMLTAQDVFAKDFARRVAVHPAARLNGLEYESDYRALKNAMKRARRARRGK